MLIAKDKSPLVIIRTWKAIWLSWNDCERSRNINDDDDDGYNYDDDDDDDDSQIYGNDGGDNILNAYL